MVVSLKFVLGLADRKVGHVDDAPCPTYRGSLSLRHRRVEERREHRELGIRETGEIAGHAATAQPEQLDRVLATDDVRIPDDEQGGLRDRLNTLRRPGIDFRV
jgi:hypothetical protein